MPRREWKNKLWKISENSFGTTHQASAVALENAGVDLDICIRTTFSKNSTALKVTCPPPEIGEISGKFRRPSFMHLL
jgi:hypothetical protein